MTYIVNLNNASNYVLKSFAELNTQRVITIVLPFLALNSKTAMISGIGIGCYQFYSLLTTTADKTTTGNKWTEGALLASSTALSYFFPGAQFILSNGVAFAVHTYQLVYADSWQKGKAIYQIAQQTIYISSICHGTVAWYCASLLAQAGGELIEAWEAHRKENKTPEKIALVLLALVRIGKAASYMPRNYPSIKAKKIEPLPPIQEPAVAKAAEKVSLEEKKIDAPTPQEIQATAVEKIAVKTFPTELAVKEKEQLLEKESAKELQEPLPAKIEEPAAVVSNDPPTQPLKKMTQQDWGKFSAKFNTYFTAQYILADPSKGKPLDVRAELLKAGFSTDIEGIRFESTFLNCSFQGLNFKDCKFKYNTFRFCTFDQISFNHCNFKSSIWTGVELQNSCFNECNFLRSRFDVSEEEASFNSINPPIQPIKNRFINLEFINCDFYKTLWAHISINKLKINKASFIKSYIEDCHIENSTINDCNFSLGSMTKVVMGNTVLSKVNLKQSIWYWSHLDHLTIQEGKLSEAIFLGTSVAQSQLIDCDLTDALLLDAKEGFSIQGGIPHQITKPIVALGWTLDDRGDYEKLTTRVLRENNILVLPYNNNKGHHVSDKAQLKLEIANQYKKISNKELSISQQLLQDTVPGSQIDMLKKDAAEILRYADGLILPGGGDIEICLYKLEYSKICFRSLLEIALVSEAMQRKIPTMGICRGAQMLNVFFGGTLHDVPSQSGTHTVQWTDSAMGTELRQRLGDNFKVESAHHQAVDQVGKGLEVVLKRNDIPKMLLSEDGIFIASQIHPEAYSVVKEELEKQDLYDEKMLEEVRSVKASEILVVINSLFEEVQKKIQEQHPTHVFLNKHIEVLKKNIMSQSAASIEVLNLIFANKNIYHFFFNKVERFRTSKAPSKPPESS
jgi:putative glutamine amidotransferase